MKGLFCRIERVEQNFAKKHPGVYRGLSDAVDLLLLATLADILVKFSLLRVLP